MEYTIDWSSSEDFPQGATAKDHPLNSELLLAFLKSSCGIKSGSRILEIGCGNGVFGKTASAEGIEVTMIDPSEAAVETTIKSMGKNQKVLCSDWESVSLEDPVFSEKFDATVCTFSPEVQSADSLRKMNKVTVGWCVVTRYLMYNEPMMDQFCAELGLRPKSVTANLKREYIDLNANVTAAGHMGQVHFLDYKWDRPLSPKEASELFMKWYYAGKALDEDTRSKVFAAAEKISGGKDTINDSVKAHVARICWPTGRGRV